MSITDLCTIRDNAHRDLDFAVLMQREFPESPLVGEWRHMERTSGAELRRIGYSELYVIARAAAVWGKSRRAGR